MASRKFDDTLLDAVRQIDSISRESVITGTRIVFSTKSDAGVVDYDGRLKGKRIDFRSFSHINQRVGSHVATFVELDFPSE